MSNTATCANCHATIERINEAWYHRVSGSAWCHPALGGDFSVARPIPKGVSVVRHYGDPKYRPACGQPLSPSLDTNPDWKETTCQRCMGTLKFKQAKGMTVKEPVANPQKCVHCNEPISFHAWSSRWLHTSGPNEPESEWCGAKGGLKATPPPLSPPKIEVTAPEPPEQENEAVSALKERIRLVESTLAGTQASVKTYEEQVRLGQQTLDRLKKFEAKDQQRLDELNHALNLIGKV